MTDVSNHFPRGPPTNFPRVEPTTDWLTNRLPDHPDSRHNYSHFPIKRQRFLDSTSLTFYRPLRTVDEPEPRLRSDDSRLSLVRRYGRVGTVTSLFDFVANVSPTLLDFPPPTRVWTEEDDFRPPINYLRPNPLRQLSDRFSIHLLTPPTPSSPHLLPTNFTTTYLLLHARGPVVFLLVRVTHRLRRHPKVDVTTDTAVELLVYNRNTTVPPTTGDTDTSYYQDLADFTFFFFVFWVNN